MSILLQSVTKSYQAKIIFQDITLSCERGQLLGLIGPSGSGKSTLAKCIVGLERVDSGVISVLGHRLDHTTDPHSSVVYEVRRKTSYVLQNVPFLPYKKIDQAISLPLLVTHNTQNKLLLGKISELAKLLQITHVLDKYPYQLSGGERARAALLRSIIHDPAFLIIDEVTSGVDPVLAGEIASFLQTFTSRGMGIILISHQIDFIRRNASHVYFLNHCSIQEHGVASKVLDDPQTEELKSFIRLVRKGW